MCVRVSECVYNHSPSQPITVLRSRQLSPLSFSVPSLLLLFLLHPFLFFFLTAESQRGVSAWGPAPMGSHYTTVGFSFSHRCPHKHETSLCCLFLSITMSLHPSIKPLALSLRNRTHTHFAVSLAYSILCICHWALSRWDSTTEHIT